MALPTTFFNQLGIELATLRGIEAAWEWMNKVAGSPTYFRDFINARYDNTIQNEDTAETLSKSSLESSVEPSLVSVHSARKSDFETYFFAYLDAAAGTPDADIQAGAIGYTYDAVLAASSEFRISDRSGRFGFIRERMVAEAKNIIRNLVTLGSFTAGSANVGVLADSLAAGDDQLLTGTLNFIVTGDTVGAIDLSVTLTLGTPLIDGSTTFSAENTLRVGKFFEDGQLGLQIQLDLGAVVETGDDGNVFSATTVTNPAEGDSAKGRHFIEVERLAVGGGGPHFRVRWFRAGSLLATDKVTEVDVTGEAGSAVVTLIGSSSTISTTMDKAAAAIKLPVATNKDSDIVFDLKSPRIGDNWSKAVTNGEEGKFASKIARRYRAALLSGPAKSSTNPTAALAGAGAGNVDNGLHSWLFTLVEGSKESARSVNASTPLNVVDKTVDGKVDLTGVAAGPAGTTARRIYRTVAGNSGPYKFVGVINDNVTTTFQDNVADASLGAATTTEIDDTLANSLSMT